ncbi:MAG: hypothetical protein RLZZ535_3307, partial [Cyanobacteriota bacterium]
NPEGLEPQPIKLIETTNTRASRRDKYFLANINFISNDPRLPSYYQETVPDIWQSLIR